MNKRILILITFGVLIRIIPVNGQATENFVKSYKARTPTASVDTVTGGTPAQSYKDIVYYDGLGRPKQNISIQRSVNGKDVILPVAYDPVGRQKRKYLPYVEASGTQDGRFRANAIAAQTSHYSNHYSDTSGFTENDYEPSPLNRVNRQAPPGTSWKLGSGKEIKFSRRPNTALDGVRIITVNSSGLPVSTLTFAASLLWAEITDDEDNRRSVEYTDKLGRVVLKKVQDTALPTGNGHAGWLCTYYVYNDFGRLRVVIPPQAVRVLDSNNWVQATNIALADAQYFRYKYDGRGRITEKKVPGKVVEYYLYDTRDRPVGFQDGNLRSANKWLYTKYDALGRAVMTGLTPATAIFDTLQATLNTGSNNAEVKENTANIRTGSTITSDRYDGYKEYVASSSITLKNGFSMKATGNQSFTARIGTPPASGAADAWPTDEGEILTVTYYDSYSNLSGYAYSKPASPYSGFEDHSTRVHGLMTGRKVKNLETGELYTSAYFYDAKGRVIQTLSEHQMGGTVRNSTIYDFEDRPTHTLAENSAPSSLKILRTMEYNVAGDLYRIRHKVGTETERILAQYTYYDLGQRWAKTFPEVNLRRQTYSYNIRGWLTDIGTNQTEIFKQTLYYNQAGPNHPQFNGNIARMDWTDRNLILRTYNYQYDTANRLNAGNFTSSATTENTNYTVSGISYDANGNILKMQRRGQMTASPTYGLVDNLTYVYGSNSNQLLNVTDGLQSNTYTSRDFKPDAGSSYSYDANGNQTTNKDKRIASITYNHLNLPDTVTFTGSTGKIIYGYDALGNKLTQKVYSGSTLSKTQQYIGEMVYLNGTLDYLVQEEGRVAYEEGTYQYEFFVKDHLGNVRQVLRNPSTQVFMATMETQEAATEEASFSQLSESRQLAPEHNKTEGGEEVAWLNASRGRLLGPSRTQEIYEGDSIRLSVFGKYADQDSQAGIAGFAPVGGTEKLVNDLNELALLAERSGNGNPFTLLNLANILAGDLQQRPAPEAYLMYALYDSDSNRYEVGKQVLSKNAANQHEELEENLYISEDGFMETFVVNETSEDVWFDNMMVTASTSLVFQETHYDPWGLELTGLGFQYGGIKVNKYLYQGKEWQTDHNLNIYDFHARAFDPITGRTLQQDPHSESYFSLSPYSWVGNNPLRFIDPDGKDIIGTDDKPVSYQLVNGQAVWSKNASPDVMRIGNAMIQTKTGTQQLNAMINSNTKINLRLSSDPRISKNPETGKTTVRYGDTMITSYETNPDGSYTANGADITIFEGTIKVIVGQKKELSGDAGETQRIGVEGSIGAVAAHESIHATDQTNVNQNLQNQLQRTNHDIEKKPNEIKQQVQNELLRKKDEN